jgi:hypothetical protein
MMPQLKAVNLAGVAATNSAATAIVGPIDTIGADWCTIDVLSTTQAASTQAGSPTVLKLQEADVTAATSFVDIVGTRGGSATATNVDFVVGIGYTATTTATAYKFNVDCRARKRYLQLVATPAASQTFSVTANLGRNEQSPSTAAKAGVLNLIEV